MLELHRTSTTEAFAAGELGSGAVVAEGRLTVAGPSIGTWVGPWVEPAAGFRDVIVSWNAELPPGARLDVELQVTGSDESTSAWYVLGRWAFDDADFRRTSVGDQDDDRGRVDVDTFRGRADLAAYRVRLSLRAGAGGAPTVRLLTALAGPSADAGVEARVDGVEPPRRATSGGGIELAVPTFSQRLHAGEYPEYDGGGASWCSPASTSMVLAYWGVGPSAAETSWVEPGCPEPRVAHAARYTFDYGFGGTGNWPFNTAFAASFGLDAFVTRLRSLAEAELFLHQGIPLVASIAVEPGALGGFPLPAGTTGHLVVLIGRTPAGDPIVNDPAAEANDSVRRIYDRAQFEAAWLDGSGGVVYVISRPGSTLPPSAGNW